MIIELKQVKQKIHTYTTALYMYMYVYAYACVCKCVLLKKKMVWDWNLFLLSNMTPVVHQLRALGKIHICISLANRGSYT